MSNYNYNNYNYNNSPGPGPYTPGPGQQPPQNDGWIDVVAWIIDIGLIGVIWPLGVILTVMKSRGNDVVGDLLRLLVGKNGQRTSSAARQTQGYTRTTSQRTASQQQTRTTSSRQSGYTPGAAAASGTTEAKRTETAKDAPAKEDKAVRRADAGATVREVFGWIIAVFGLLAAFSTISASGTIWSVLTSVGLALGGGLLVLSGRQGKKKEAAFRRCMTVSGDKGIVKLKPLAKTLGMTEEALEKQLSEMIDRGYYGARAYIDHARELLVIEPEQMRDIYRAEDEEKARQAQRQGEAEEEARKASQTEYERLIERIRQADIDIEDEPMSEKIRQMQSITEAIFQEVEEHPEKRPQIERFMNYYLPTTLKLLESYARIEDQGVSGENTAKAKADIERIADTLVEGYRKQLDTLYQAEAVDIAGDVSVIESMMRRDGLTGQSDFRPFKQFVEPGASAQAEQTGGEVMGGH